MMSLRKKPILNHTAKAKKKLWTKDASKNLLKLSLGKNIWWQKHGTGDDLPFLNSLTRRIKPHGHIAKNRVHAKHFRRQMNVQTSTFQLHLILPEKY